MSLSTEQTFVEIDSTLEGSGDQGRHPTVIPPASARLPQFIGGRDVAPLLAGWRLAIVAAGSVGRRIALSAARLHPQALWIIDPASYKPESVLTQEITPADIGQGKAISTAQSCKAISPKTRVWAFAGEIQKLPDDALIDADACALSTDNLKAEVETGQRMLRLGIPLAHGSVHGDSLVAQVRFFANRDGNGPCPACGFTTAEWDHLNRETAFRCQGEDGASEETTQSRPTMSTAFLCSLAADLTMVQLVRHRLKLGKPVDDSLLQYCGYTHAVTAAAPLKRNPHCPCEHIVWRRATTQSPLSACSLATIADIAGPFLASAAGEEASFRVDQMTWSEAAWCCGEAHRVGRFVRPGEQLGLRCSSCGKPLSRQPFYLHRWAPASSAPLQTPLKELGATRVEYVAVRRGDRAVLVRSPRT